MSDFTTEAFTLLAVGLVIIGARTYARCSQVGIRGLEADDYLMVLAAVVYSTETALAYSVGAIWHGLANNNMTDEERKNLDPSSQEYALRVGGSKTQVAGWSTYTFLLWLLKLCMCIFYFRLTSNLLGYKTRIHIGLGLVGATWLTVLFSILFGCGLPFAKNWQIHPDPGNLCQPAISRLDILMTVVLNVLTDLYLMTIPLPMLWQTTLPRVQKAALAVCFSGGLFVTMAGILRCIYIITDPVNGAQLAGSWAVRESFVAVLTTNLPMLWKFLRFAVSPLLGSFASRSRSLSGFWRSNNNKRSTAAGGGGGGRTPEPGSFQLQDSAHSGFQQGGDNTNRMAKLSGRRGPKSLYPVTVLSESEERIMYTEQQQQQQQQQMGPGATTAHHGHDGDGGAGGFGANSSSISSSSRSSRRQQHGGGAGAPGIEVKRDIEISIEETTGPLYQQPGQHHYHRGLPGGPPGRTSDDFAYLQPKNTTAGAYVHRKM